MKIKKTRLVIHHWVEEHSKRSTKFKNFFVLNYHLLKHNFKRKYLEPCWNLFAIHKKEMFIHNWQLKEDMTPFFIKSFSKVFE